MKKSVYSIVFLAMMIFFYIVTPLDGQMVAEWSSGIKKDTNYHWKATKSELRDLDTNEKYRHSGLLGGINVPNGGTTIMINNNMTTEFDFFEGDRLDLWITVEGDMVISSDLDYQLAILPIKLNGTNFFNILFENATVLENLSNSTYISSEINNDRASVLLKVNSFLNVSYRWDIKTGLLLEKEVVGLSGKKLLIVQGKGVGFPGLEYIEIFSGLILISGLISLNRNFLKKKKKK